MMLVDIAFPFTDTYIPTYCRKPRSLSGWWDRPVEILTVAAASTPIAYRVLRPGARVEVDDIKFHGGRFWWPVFPPYETAPLSVHDFIAHPRHPFGYFVATLEAPALPREAARGLAHRTDAEISSELPRSWESTRQTEYIRAQRSASRLLLCGDAVYREGGPPAYFADVIRSAGERFFRCGSEVFTSDGAMPTIDTSIIFVTRGWTRLQRSVCSTSRRSTIASLTGPDAIITTWKWSGS